MTKEEQWLLEEKYSGVESPEFQKDASRLAQGEPLAYVIGSAPFLGLKMYLDSRPLIPRPETEWWTKQLIDAAPAHARILDLCAGSGAIGCALLKAFPDAAVSFAELDPAHEATIRKNIEANGLDTKRADIRIGDLFEPFRGEQFDIVAANPPYIPQERPLPLSVAQYEPELALRAGDDGLTLIRRIAKELGTYLKPSGEAWIECDSEHAGAACALFLAQGFTAQIRHDQYDAPRVIVVSYPQ